ncbi:hypothetical protein WMY93_005945 [Mugilogobius chulae]|uniref:Target of Myb protein 1 n=1 Tax=Mugilogobius chulae TaxID=88201 RepID=A0AAW0PI75_9GOBI
MEICDIINESEDGPKDAVKAIKKRMVGNKNFAEIMSSLTSWADAFRSAPSLSGVVQVYDDLRKRGLEFPMTDLDALSPIHTPTREQKLRSELALVKGNLTVMSEMLNEMTPGQSKTDDLDLLQQLYSVCKKMQSRVVELIPQLVDEGFVDELLVVNDDLNNIFIRYERFDRLNKAKSGNNQQSGVSSPSLGDFSPVELSNPSQPAVITTTSQTSVNASTSHKQTDGHRVEEEEFDMFAQTRGSSLAEQRKSVKYEDPGAVEGLAGALDTRLQVTAGSMPVAKNPVQNDIDQWLASDMQENQSAVSEGVSSEEFDRFLEDRTQAGDYNNRTSRPSPQQLSRPQRQSTEKQDRTDQLFSL